ncbi:TPA: hypothetical protein MIB60_16570 [Klebsiella pneumoniae]|nr:hypothetical protein [Klebsiella pneumoniae]HBX7003163.1 hypothetical protein [Klebsiella pneumoniae]HBX7104246.1 hypothetical protein [Klebsiella pneumoniae]HBX7197286.1 hypothetical protein [Klebsiella pneumoniae]HBX7228513.1 hypothetical protein [Klebsiella pneumoniae]
MLSFIKTLTDRYGFYTMKKALIILGVLVALVGFVLFGIPALLYGVPRIVSPSTAADCTQYTNANITKVITEDFYKRLPTWDNDVGLLKSKRPDLTFEKPSISGGSFFVPFKATSNIRTIQYFASFDCKYDRIEYSSNKTE